jgi:ribosomal subunit interface protein
VDIVVTGRNVEVPEHYRSKVADKLTRVERYDTKIVRAQIELSHETNRRLSKVCQKVEITLVTKGPAIRAEGKAENFYAALEQAMDKLENRARRAADRRHHRQHDRTPITALAHDGALTGSLLDEAQEHILNGAAGDATNGVDATPAPGSELDGYAFDAGGDGQGADGGPGRVVRVKDHPADPITVDQALFQMELVGHDFYLFTDADTGLPTVVYRRHAFDYGLLRLS